MRSSNTNEIKVYLALILFVCGKSILLSHPEAPTDKEKSKKIVEYFGILNYEKLPKPC